VKVVVCVKHVPDGRVRVDPVSRRIDRSGSGDLNTMDVYAVEEALRLREGPGSGEATGEVVAVSMGPESAAESLRTALALGADRAVLVSDPAAAGSDLVATSIVLAAVVEREAPDLVLFGQQTSDGGGALLWAAVAERLQRPAVSQVTALRLDGGTVRATRQTEFGDEVIEASLPAIVAVTDAINEPRYASLRGMMAAKRKQLEVLSLADLDISAERSGEAGSKTEVLALGAPPVRGNPERIDDEASAAQAIVDFLVERQLV
jgi:electron transfer flavoprotein beta subunit